MSPCVEALRAATPGQWVVLSDDETRIVASGNDLEKLAADARESGVQDPVLVLVPPDWTPRVLMGASCASSTRNTR